MNRLKLLLFAGPVLAVWAWSTIDFSKRLLARSEDSTIEANSNAVETFSRHVTLRRSEVQTALVKLAEAGTLTQIAQGSRLGRAEAVSPQVFNALRTEVFNALPEALQEGFVVGVVTGPGAALYARGHGDPAVALDGLPSDGLVDAGAAGVAVVAFHEPHVFYSLSLTAAAEEKKTAVIVLGAPLLSHNALADTAKAFNLDAAAVMVDGQMYLAVGPAQRELPGVLKQVLPGGQGVVTRGRPLHLGPIGLPWVGREPPPTQLAFRRALSAAPVELVGIVSMPDTLHLVAELQRVTLFGLGGALLLLAVAMAWVKNAGPNEGKEEEAEEEEEVFEAEELTESPRQEEPFAAEEPAPPSEELGPPVPPMEDSAPEGEGPFAPLSPPSEEEQTRIMPLGVAEPVSAEDPFASFGVPSDSAGGFPSTPVDQTRDTLPPPQTTSLVGEPAPADVAAQFAGPMQGGDESEDETRVVSIPGELLAAAARPITTPPSPVPRTSKSSLPAMNGSSEDEEHFQQIYEEFVATREQCGEPRDSLTFEKFAVKLKKNREQLIQKLSCRTVRFQVYVKEGKAALRATPIRD